MWRSCLVGGILITFSLSVPITLAAADKTATQVARFRWHAAPGVNLWCEVVEYKEAGEHLGARLSVLTQDGKEIYSYDGDAFRSAVPLEVGATFDFPMEETLLLVEWLDGRSWELIILRSGGTRVVALAEYGFKYEPYALLNVFGDDVPAIVTWDEVPAAAKPTAEWPLEGTIHRWVQGSFVDSGKISESEMAACIVARKNPSASFKRPK
jgi:hypothetical protein